MKKLRPNVQLYTKSGGGGTLPVGLGQAGGGIFFIVDALDTKAKGYDVTISFPKEGIGTAAEGIALLKGAKNPALGKKLIDWATSPAMQNLYAKHKINFVPAHPDGADRAESLAAVLKDAKIFADRRRLRGREPQAHRRPLDRRDPALSACVTRRRRMARARRRAARPRSGARRHGRRRCGCCSRCSSSIRCVMLVGTAFVDDGQPALGPLHRACCRSRSTQRAFFNRLLLGTLVGIIGTALGFLFAFTVSRGEPAALAACASIDARDLAAADLAAVHDVDRVHLLVRAARAHHLRAARHHGHHGLRPLQHARCRRCSPTSRSPI